MFFDNPAAFLLMARFAQPYLNPQRTHLPAQGLAEARRWRHSDAINRVLSWYNPLRDSSEGQFIAERAVLHLDYKGNAEEIRLAARTAKETDALPYSHPIYQTVLL